MGDCHYQVQTQSEFGYRYIPMSYTQKSHGKKIQYFLYYSLFFTPITYPRSIQLIIKKKCDNMSLAPGVRYLLLVDLRAPLTCNAIILQFLPPALWTVNIFSFD